MSMKTSRARRHQVRRQGLGRQGLHLRQRRTRAISRACSSAATRSAAIPTTQEDRFYDCGRRAIDESQWDRAVEYFTRAAAVKGNRADGALYWKAYSQNRLGQRAEALTTLAELKSGYAKSRWTNDANALEVEVRQRSGQKVDPANTSDDELKLLALNALGRQSGSGADAGAAAGGAAVAEAEGARAVRARAESESGGARRGRQDRQGRRQSRTAAPRHPVRRTHAHAGEPRGARAGLRHDDGGWRQADDHPHLHGSAGPRTAAGAGADRDRSGAADGSGASARQHARRRGAGRAVRPRDVAGREEADPARHGQRRQHRSADRAWWRRKRIPS